jgi:hypothetical protein
MAVRYIPASDQAEIGGDFYEALSWQEKILVAIGDVQGHSLHAATVMGERGMRCGPSPPNATHQWRSPAWSTTFCSAITPASWPPSA